MTYGDLIDMVSVLNTGSTNPDNLNKITKLVLGKIARKKLPSRKKSGEISVTSNDIDLRTDWPDFLELKYDVNNRDKCMYYLEGEYPFYFRNVTSSRFKENIGGGNATKDGYIFRFTMPIGQALPTKIYGSYYSYYLVLDKDGTTEKELPTDNADTFLIPSVFDDVLIDGVLLYISRREKSDKEWNKNYVMWQSSLNDSIYYA